MTASSTSGSHPAVQPGPRSTRLVLAAFLGLALTACGGETARPRGVLLISVDSLRYDHVSAYGYRNRVRPDLLTTPYVDRLLADEGAVFEEVASTTSWTLPSHLALLSGQPNEVHGVRDLPDRLGRRGPTLLAEHFMDDGWRTFGVWSGPNLHPWFGFDRGFEAYVDCSSTAVADPEALFGEGGLRDPLIEMHEDSHRGVTGERCVEAFEEQFARIGDDERFFAFVHLWDVHYDYEPPAAYDLYFPNPASYDGPFDGRDCASYGKRFVIGSEPYTQRDVERLVSLYDAEIRYTDHNIGRILGMLEEAGRLEDTLVVFTSDHGEEFFDHGGFGHKHTLYEEVLRVPLIMRLDGVIEPG
ncbi:MAG: sulfatase, partial [Planctomycetota bacterium]